MYLPTHFAENRRPVLHDVIRAHPLATFISGGPDGLDANHFPMCLGQDASGRDVLQGHVPRANPVWQTLHQHPALAIFHGPQAYVSPGWYPGKREHGKVVPTWNYVVVHVRGQARAMDDTGWLASHLQTLVSQAEAEFDPPWRITDAPAAFTETMIGALVGIELPVAHMVGKWKVSQNRSAADRQGVVDGLRDLGSTDHRAVADLIERYGGDGPG